MSYTKYTGTLQPREQTKVKKHNVDMLNTGSMESWPFIDNVIMYYRKQTSTHLTMQSLQPWCMSGVL